MPCRPVDSSLRQLPRVTGACPVARHVPSYGRCLAQWSHAWSLGTFAHRRDASRSGRMPGRLARLVVEAGAACGSRMPGRSTHVVVAAHPWSPGGRSSAQPACLAQPGIPADRFAREIVRFLKVASSALAAAECQPVGRAGKEGGVRKHAIGQRGGCLAWSVRPCGSCLVWQQNAASLGTFGRGAGASCGSPMPRRSVRSVLWHMPRVVGACLVARHVWSRGNCRVWQQDVSSLGTFGHWGRCLG